MKVINLNLSGLKLLKPTVYKDPRGSFVECYQAPVYKELGISCNFVQDNCSTSKRHTIRGMHFQAKPGQDKLVTVMEGRIYDVVVDIRPASPTYGQWEAVELDAESFEQLFIPVGFAHGFCVLSETAKVYYKVSNVFDPMQEKGFRWDDPEIGIEWPSKEPVLSLRDLESPFFSEVSFR